MMKIFSIYFQQTKHNLDYFALESCHPVPTLRHPEPTLRHPELTLRHPERSEGSPYMARDLNLEIPHYVRDNVDYVRDEVDCFRDDVDCFRDDSTTRKGTL